MAEVNELSTHLTMHQFARESAWKILRLHCRPTASWPKTFQTILSEP